jgi:hypothetical protein
MITTTLARYCDPLPAQPLQPRELFSVSRSLYSITRARPPVHHYPTHPGADTLPRRLRTFRLHYIPTLIS